MRTFTPVPEPIADLLRQCSPSRRDFLKTSGLLVVSFVAQPFPPSLRFGAAGDGAAAAAGPYPDPDYKQLDSWIVVHEDNTATFYVGKTDLGQGTGTSFRQMMSDELDIPFERTSVIMGSTDLTVDQGGSGGPDAIQVHGWPMRRVGPRWRHRGERRRGQACQLRRARRRPAIQCDADRRQHRRHHRPREGEARTAAPDGRPVAAALRHSTQGGWIGEVGG